MKLAERLKRISERTGQLISWLSLPLVIGTFVVVVLRYAFDFGRIWMQEGVVWMHAAIFMLAAAYTLNRDEHVRVDIFYRKMSARGKAWVNTLGTLVFLVPVSLFLIITSWGYVWESWAIGEGSREAGGLPYPFVPLLKSLIPFTAILLLIQGTAVCIESVATLLSGRDRTAD